MSHTIRLPEPGEIIRYGCFPQVGHYGDRTPVEWRVLAVKKDSLLLLSEHILTAMPLMKIPGWFLWSRTDCRAWLNRDFAGIAFGFQKTAVLPCGISGIEEDRIFLLSREEAERYLPRPEDRVCAPTDYAANVEGVVRNEVNGAGTWWLRSAGDLLGEARTVGPDGVIGVTGGTVTRIGIRPVMWLDARKNGWSGWVPGRNDPAKKYSHVLFMDN